MAKPGFNAESVDTVALTLVKPEDEEKEAGLHAEVHSQLDRRPMSAKDLTKKLEQLMNQLETASEIARTKGVHASVDAYSAAVRTAESIDQLSVSRERKNIREQLKDRNLDLVTRKELLQADADLHTLERSKGFTRANYALALIRNGEQQQGNHFLQEAQARDREMSADPNFKRHLKDAVQEGQDHRTKRVTEPAFISFDEPGKQQAPPSRRIEPKPPAGQIDTQPTPLVIPPAQFGGQPSRTPQTYPSQSFAPSEKPRVEQPLVQPFAGPFAPPSAAETRPDQTAAQPALKGDKTSSTLKVSALDSQNRTPVQAISALWGEVCRTNTMTAEVQQAFLKAVENSSDSVSPQLIPLVRQQQDAADAVRSALTAEVADKIESLDATALALLKKLPAEKARASYKLYSNLDGASSAEERNKMTQQLLQLEPSFGPILTARDQAMGPALIKAVMSYAKSEKDLDAALRSVEGQAEANQAAVTRFSYGLALEKVGRKEEAKAYVAEALKLNASTDVGQNAFWYDTAKRMGIAVDAPAQTGAPSAPKEAKPITPPQPGDAADLLGQAAKKYHQAITRGAPAKEAFQQVLPDFQKAVAKADADFTATAAKTAAMDKLAQEVEKEVTPELLAKVAPINALIRSEKAKVSPEFENLIRDYQDVTQPDDKRAAMRAELSKAAPGLLAAYDQLEAVAGKSILTKFIQVQKDQLLVAESLGKRFNTRLLMADYADRAGNQEFAKQLLTEGLATLPEALQIKYMEQPDVTTLAAKLKVIAPVPPDAVLSPLLNAKETAAEAIKPVAGVDPENQGLRPDQIVQLAKQKLQAEGMTAATKKLFEDAIRVADSLFGAPDTKNIEQALARLQSNKHENGRPLTIEERLFAHDKINKSFALSTYGIQCRTEYATQLLQHKQYQTAEKVQRERINAADALPLELIKKEMDILLNDMQNPKIARRTQLDLANLRETYAGSGRSKEDGLIYMPVVCRKMTIDFYMSARENQDFGIYKPDQAFHMINEIKDVETRRYGVDFAKNPGADASLMQRAKVIEPEISPNLKKDLARYDTWWSNAVVDGTAAGVALTGAALLASLATKRPEFFRMALTADKTALSTGGKVLLSAGVIGTATTTRHYLHQALTGNSEGWDQSLIHGSAGVGGVVAIMGTRGTLGNWLLKGASEKGLVVKIAERYGTTVEAAEGAAATQKLTVEQYGKYLAENQIAISQTTKEYIAKNGAEVLVEGGVVKDAVFDAVKIGLNPAQSTALAVDLSKTAAGGVERGIFGRNIDRIVRGYQNAKGLSPFGSLDLATASAGQIRMRAGYANFAEAAAGLGTYNTIAALDRVDPGTGEKISYADSLLKAHYRNPMDNTLANALFLQLLMKNGNVARTSEAGLRTKLMTPISASKWGVGATATTGGIGELATVQAMAKQGAYLSFASRAFDLSGRYVDIQYGIEARKIRQKLDKMGQPITNEAPPTVRQVDTVNITPTSEAEPPPAAVPPSGDLKDEPVQKPKVDLTKDTPGI